MPLALGLLRATNDGATASCSKSRARAMPREPVPHRSQPKELILEEEVLRRVAEASAGSDAKLFDASLQRLDAIELVAEKQSDWAQTGGVDLLAAALVDSVHKREAYDAYAKLVLRGPESHWIVRACERRMKELGDKNAVAHNLACVHARAGDAYKALATLALCKKPLEENPQPGKDTDLQLLWQMPEFVAMIGSEKRLRHSRCGASKAIERAPSVRQLSIVQ